MRDVPNRGGVIGRALGRIVPLAALLAACAAPPIAEPRRCNGREDLCDRPFDAVALPATHNAMSNAEDGWVAPNQRYGLERQLDDGIRGMLLDVYDDGAVLRLCHGACSLGQRPLLSGLEALRGFLDDHPDEVLAIVFEDHASPERVAAVFAESGLDRYVYTWGGGPWPTLGAMIDAGTRLVVGAESAGPPPAWYHHAWDLWFDTPYSFEAVADLRCTLNRGSAANPLFLVNHWLSDPLSTRALAEVANTQEVLGERAVACRAEAGHQPNLLAVDQYDTGVLFEAVDALNDLGPP